MSCFCKIHEVEGLEDIKYFQDEKAMYFSFPPHLSAYGHFLATYYTFWLGDIRADNVLIGRDSYKTFTDLFDKLCLININNKPIFTNEEDLIYLQNSHAYIIDDCRHDHYYAERAWKKCDARQAERRRRGGK